MDVQTSLSKLFSLHTFGVKLGLDNITKFLDYLGNPQRQLKTIHVAGSNGKGSTSSFISSILQEGGYRVGLYTSPHFVKFNERIVINGQQIDNDYIAKFVSENVKFIDDYQLTFFEVTTALAFKYFLEMKTDYCVIETGLGGRLDATNVLQPLAVVITSISLEHTNVLGNTLEQIAFEKAAIIKNEVNVFTGILRIEAENVIANKCIETHSKLFNVKDFVFDNGTNFQFIIEGNYPIEINPPLKGKYQKYNAALAALTVAKTFPEIKKEKYLTGIAKVSGNTGIQGRYEYFNRKPDIIFDSAHNSEGVENFLREFQNEAKFYNKRTLLFGVMRDKAIEDLLSMLSKYFDEILITKIKYERAAAPNEIINICKKLELNCKEVEEPGKFVLDFRNKPIDECLVVLGSMYLLGEIKEFLLQGVS
jgi:dihydrofolate synthase/folylpolyglutamate synthase